MLEVIVALGVATLIIGGSATMLLNIQKMTNHLEARQNTLIARSDFQISTAVTSFCEKAIKLKSGKFQTIDLTASREPSGTGNPGSPIELDLFNGLKMKSGATLSEYGLAIERLDLHDLTHVSIIPGGDRYLATIEAEFVPTKSTAGPQKFVRNLGAIFVDVNASTEITSCTSSQPPPPTTSTNPNTAQTTNCGCSLRMPWGSLSSPTTCPADGHPSGTLAIFSCGAGGRGTSVCVTGTWAVTNPCPRDGK